MDSGIDVDALVRPLGDAEPCGTNLEDTQEMAAIDAFRVFGQSTPLKTETDWRAIKDASLEALGTSKDFRLLAHLAAASLRIDGMRSLLDSLGVASRWLTEYYDTVYPRVDEDAVLRKNALNYFADRMAIVDALRRVPLVSNRRLGNFSLRQVEIAAGTLTPTEEEGAEPPTEAQITGAFSDAPQEELTQLVGALSGGIEALKSIAAVMVEKQGVQAAPDTGPLSDTLMHMKDIVARHVRAPVAEGAAAGANAGAGAGAIPGQIRSRDDAIRSLDAVSEFFRREEPSSPVPLFVDRAKRLIARDFLEVLAELAPDSLAAVKHVGGIRDQE
jgi:type VI secretion system protein ImpA